MTRTTGRSGPVVALISLEAWDDTWRRNQHFASQLVAQGLVERVVFIEPPLLGQRSRRGTPLPGVDVIRPALRVPKRYGGLKLVAAELRRGPLRGIDVLWVNNADLGVHCQSRGMPVVHDITDDWRSLRQSPRVLRRLVAAEDVLARTARTVVCSQVLARRWHDRYGVDAAVVHNGVDLQAFVAAAPRVLHGPGPHVGYVGTLHPERLDVPLVLELAASGSVGTLHLVGPNHLGAGDIADLERAGVQLPGAVPSWEVPSWTKAMDVLISPHVLSDFTLSLDAIKSYEYLAAGRPVVATPTSGFQLLEHPALAVVAPDGFVAAVAAPPAGGGQPLPKAGWDARARDFARELGVVYAACRNPS